MRKTTLLGGPFDGLEIEIGERFVHNIRMVETITGGPPDSYIEATYRKKRQEDGGVVFVYAG